MSGGAADNSSRRGREASMGYDRHLEAARGYLALEMPEHALREIGQIGGKVRDAADCLRLKGDAFKALLRDDDAVTAYTRTLVEWPDCLPALLGIATCYRRLGQLGRAVAAVEDANRYHPNEPAVLFALARLYMLTGETSRALGWLGRAVRMCPEVGGWAEADEDFSCVKQNPYFQLLLDAAKTRQRA
jgi:tetratricopeptide (TPR) repeat protein